MTARLMTLGRKTAAGGGIAVEAAGKFTGATTSLPGTITVPSVANGLLMAWVAIRGNNETDSATWNGTGMTFVDAAQSASTTSGREIGMFYLAGPEPGTFNLTVNLSVADNAIVQWVVLSGVDQATPIRSTSNLAGSSSGTKAQAISSTASDLCMAGISAGTFGAASPYDAANATLIESNDGTPDSFVHSWPGASPTRAVGYVLSSAVHWSLITCSIAPA